MTKMRIILNNPKPSQSSYLKPDGFASPAEEYAFFYESRSPYGFECPDGTVRIVQAINYYWECLGIIRHDLGITDAQIAAQAFSMARSIDCNDETFDKVFAESVLIEIEDQMEVCRRSGQS